MANDQNAQAAFENLFLEYFKPLCAYCQLRFRFDIHMAKDIVHTAFIKLIESQPDQSGELPGRAYLFTAVKNLCLDRVRHETVKTDYQRFVQRNLSASDEEGSRISIEFKDLERSIQEAVAALPDQMRLIFELSRYEGLKYSQIAEQLGISVKTVETQMSRALRKLREALADHLEFWLLIFLIYHLCHTIVLMEQCMF